MYIYLALNNFRKTIVIKIHIGTVFFLIFIVYLNIDNYQICGKC